MKARGPKQAREFVGKQTEEKASHHTPIQPQTRSKPASFSLEREESNQPAIRLPHTAIQSDLSDTTKVDSPNN
ncbi:hypothetical protein QE152_g7317 [Popillia japonica]|uniref:Uncharacterized protein n=1 Tax=Popillia japonica TaxID=7064 RepID=A0AAW1MBV1_POPJA